VIRILAAASPGELRVAVCDGDVLEEYAIWRPGAPDGLGDIFAGRVIARVPAMAGAFVALPGAEGFLPDTEGPGLVEGALIKVRVTRSAQGGKGPRLALADGGTLPDGVGPGLIARGPSPLHRIAARYPGAEIGIDDAAWLARLRPGLSGCLHLVQPGFPEALEAEIEALSASWTDLPGGLRAGFFPTPALTAIDLDGGTASAARGEKTRLQFAANRAALPALARQIRLRNLSGAILIDFAGLPARRRAALAEDLAQCLAPDPVQPRLLGFTALGLAEILRPRTSPPLHEVLAGPHAAGLLALRHLARNPGAPRARPCLRAAPDVIAALQADPAALEDFAGRSIYALALQSDPALPSCTVLPDFV
jgi:hypothetical protein